MISLLVNFTTKGLCSYDTDLLCFYDEKISNPSGRGLQSFGRKTSVLPAEDSETKTYNSSRSFPLRSIILAASLSAV